MLSDKVKHTATKTAEVALKQLAPDVQYELLLSILSAMFVRGWAACVEYQEGRDGGR